MHILRLSTLALGLAAVLGLLVGWSSPASAHCKPNSGGPHADPDHFGCGGPPPPPPGEIIYTVEVVNPPKDLGNSMLDGVAAFPFGPVAAALDTETSLFVVEPGGFVVDRPGGVDPGCPGGGGNPCRLPGLG